MERAFFVEIISCAIPISLSIASLSNVNFIVPPFLYYYIYLIYNSNSNNKTCVKVDTLCILFFYNNLRV